jgi:DNA polymerase-3 subunit delta'
MDLQDLLPKNQKKLYGYHKEFNELVSLYKNKKLPSKIFFNGPKGIGKSTIAHHLINYIFSNKEEYKYDLSNLEINNLNKSYKLILNNTHPNFHLVDIMKDKKIIEISQIRQMINYSTKSTFNNNERIILIDNVENLNLNSLNSLLKIVEEPNENTLFILIFDSNKNILNTLKSRCLKFNLYLSFSQSVEITNKILNSNILDLISEDLLHYYNTPGEFINLVNFANSLNLNLKEFDLKKFLIHLIDVGYYKNNTFIKNNIYKYIELYLLKLMKGSTSKNKINILYNESIKKIANMKKYNLDQESIMIDLKTKLFNG